MSDRDLRQEMNNTSSRRSRGQSRAGKGSGMSPMLFAGLVIVIILAVAAVAAVSISRKKAEEESIQASIEASIAEEEALKNAAPKFEISEFTECDVPEISILAADYFDAKLKADSERLFSIFGRTDTAADPELAGKLKAQADWIQSYNDIKVFSVPGLDADSRFCLVFYNIDFRRTDTLAPGVMYFYAYKNADGEYRFAENPVKEVYDYMDAELASDSAKSMIEASNAKLREALNNDSTLALIYDSFRSGEIYKESNIEFDKEQEVGFLDPEDSVLVDADVLAGIKNEAAQKAEEEASLAAEDETE